MRIFHKGLSTLSRVSGTEHRQICAFILGAVLDAPNRTRAELYCLTSATRALLDLLYIAQFPAQDDNTLSKMDVALQEFHDNKHIFVDLNVREHFNFPKMHSLCHYTRAIRLYGTTDNYNTEATERLHIDFAKDAYRATNRKDEYPQMTKWLKRREKILFHAGFVGWRETYDATPRELIAPLILPHKSPTVLGIGCTYEPKTSRFPTLKHLSLRCVTDPSTLGYGATLFSAAVARFTVQYRSPLLNARQVEDEAGRIAITFTSIPVFHRIKFFNLEASGTDMLDSIHAYPRRVDNRGKTLRNARFDTALIRVRNPGESISPFAGLRVGRVRLVFKIPDKHVSKLFPPNLPPPDRLAYVEWFSNFTDTPELGSNLYRIKRQKAPDGNPLVSVIPLCLIQRSIHLIPKWGKAVPSHWTSENVLDMAPSFSVNAYKDRNTYFSFNRLSLVPPPAAVPPVTPQ